jgi:hypothetical protein
MCRPCLHTPRCLKQCKSGCARCIHDVHTGSGESLTERMRAKFLDELGVEDDKNKITFWLCLEFIFPGVKFTRTPTRGGTHVSMDFQDVNHMDVYAFDRKNVEFFHMQEGSLDEEVMTETGGGEQQVSYELDLGEMEVDEEENNKEMTNDNECNDEISSIGVEFRPHVGMRILAELVKGGKMLYYGTITELLLREDLELVRVRWANYNGQVHRDDIIGCKQIEVIWDKRAKAGTLGDDNKTRLPKSKNEWFDGW